MRGAAAGDRSGVAADGPPACVGAGTARQVVRAFWTELDRHYAVFDARLPGGGWRDIGESACRSLSDSTSAEELFNVIVGMARVLNDGHIQLRATDLGRRATGWATEYSHGATMAALVHNVERRYAAAPLARGANGRFAWGRIGAVGYLDLGAFEELDSLGGEERDVRAARDAMARASRDLLGVQGLIVDIRNNEGGWDAVGLEVARWFHGPRTLSYRKGRRIDGRHDAFGRWEEVHVDASPPGALDAPVIVLLSGWTFSAAETFAMSMSARPRVTLMGERTSGHLSDLEPARLPNGWRYTYSSERYLAPKGALYEGRGIPVDVPVAFDPGSFAEGRDIMLEAALDTLRARGPSSFPPPARETRP